MKEKGGIALAIIWLINAIVWTAVLLLQRDSANTVLLILRILTAGLSWLAAIGHCLAWRRRKKEEKE